MESQMKTRTFRSAAMALSAAAISISLAACGSSGPAGTAASADSATMWGLTGGNQNRYMTLEECERACPPPVGPSDCAMDLTFVESRCLDCGPIGPCITPVPRCLASCDSDSDCEAEQTAIGKQVDCNNGLCELALFCL